MGAEGQGFYQHCVLPRLDRLVWGQRKGVQISEEVVETLGGFRVTLVVIAEECRVSWWVSCYYCSTRRILASHLPGDLT